MKLYIQKLNDDNWSQPTWRSDLENVSKEEYNAQGIYDLDANVGPEVDINYELSYEIYLNEENIARYRWTKTLKTGQALVEALRDKWIFIRNIRNEFLRRSDYTQFLDSPITEEKRTYWATYRQKLRDITKQNDPFNIDWPKDPDGNSPAAEIKYA